MIPGSVCKVLVILFGVLFPAYASFKTVKNKHVKNYVKLMMYWTVFATFICIECLTDIFLEFWFPFYYDIKLIVVLWISCPFTRGSIIIYKNLVHPTLLKKEMEIDEFLINVKSRTLNVLMSKVKQTFHIIVALIIQHITVSRLPMIQQSVNMEVEQHIMPQKPVKKVRKLNSKLAQSKLLSDSMPIYTCDDNLTSENLKQNKTQHLIKI